MGGMHASKGTRGVWPLGAISVRSSVVRALRRDFQVDEWGSLRYPKHMTRSLSRTNTITGLTKAVMEASAFAAISAVEGLVPSEESQRRLDRLRADKTLSPDERRAAVRDAYLSRQFRE